MKRKMWCVVCKESRLKVKMPSLILKEILPGGACASLTTGFAVDLVVVMIGRSSDESFEVLRRLSGDIFSSQPFGERNKGGKGNGKTTYVSFTDTSELIIVLPGNQVKSLQLEFVNIIKLFSELSHGPRTEPELKRYETCACACQP